MKSNKAMYFLIEENSKYY